MNMSGKTVIVLIFFRVSICLADDPTIVTLPEGQIRGHVLSSANGNDFYAFQEIPYAAPPVGELRFQPPVAPEEWDGVLDTTQNTKICYQLTPYNVSNVTQTEDCLYLNVYTPQQPGNSDETPLPVLVWIHGGAFRVGTGAIQKYKPHYLIDHEIVIVTMNYRVGPFGFLTTEDGVIPGNIGLKDQYFAIQWVKNNINLFGGDPEKITIVGQSAGGSSVGLQLISQRNKGLFRGAIIQSGSGLCQWAHQNYARYYAFLLGRNFDENFTSDDSNQLLTVLQSVPASSINSNTITPAAGKENGADVGLIWVPVIEDSSLDGAFLTGPFHEDVRTGNINQVPILIGFSSEEELYFLRNDPSTVEEYATQFDDDLSILVRNQFNMTDENKLEASSRLQQLYTSECFEDDPGAVVNFLTDQKFTMPITRHAKLQSKYTDVYLYQFSYKGKMGGMENAKVYGVKGVGHSEDIGYLWDSRISFDGTSDYAEDLVMRQRLLKLWSNFVKYLNPTPGEDSLLSNVTWQKVTPENLVYLNINSTLEMQKNPKIYIQYEKIIDEYAIPPLVNY